MFVFYGAGAKNNYDGVFEAKITEFNIDIIFIKISL